MVTTDITFTFLLLTFFDHLAALAVVSVFSHFNPHVGVVLPGGNRAALLTMVAAAKPSEESHETQPISA